ncbi:MAG: hypothetical protein LUD14_00840 [Clostridiales bacterium]|nr:hypothetical protein [Clostridiales bacterium]
MIKPWKQVIILVLVFFAGVFAFERLMNHETQDMTADMADATLPVLYLLEGEERVNELHGYTTEMDAASVRDTITPVESGGSLSVSIDSYGNQVNSVSYEVRSLDTTRLVQESEAENLSAADDLVSAELAIQNLLTEGEEYLLVIKVTTDADTCWFYTRIIQEDDSYIRECISFVKEFHEITMDKERQSELASYMEPESSADNTTLQTVTINNSLSQACWGDFEGTEVTEPSISIKELNDSYNVILLTYILSSTDEDGDMEYYNVEEYYRVRQGAQKVYLLSFERTVEEILQGESGQIDGDTLILGIRSADVDFIANETGTVVCFVQQGELWSYNTDNNSLTQVYSFRTLGETDVRENYGEHDIRLIRASESGSVDFIVYGYMNRGEHKGEVGISVCHYDSSTNTVEEQLFIPSSDSYQIMKEEIGRAMYISDSGMFYFVMSGQVHGVDLETLEDSIFISSLTDDNYETSEDGRYLAWTSGDAAEATTLHLTDLETGETSDIEAEEGYVIRPLGFMDTDCIYGLAAKENISEESDIFAMSTIIIVDASEENPEALKTYDAGNTYVTEATIEDGNIYLSRVVLSGSAWVETESDTIYNRDMQEEDSVYVSEITSDVKQREVTLQLSQEASGTLSLLTPKQILPEESVTLELADQGEGSAYYVYAKGKVLLGTDSISEAVIRADENRGVVVGADQTYLWKRAKASSQSLTVSSGEGSSSQAKAISILLKRVGETADADALLAEGMFVYEILSSAVSEGETYNLTGCTLEQTLYFVGIGNPVYAVRDGSAVLIIGYTDSSVTIYDPLDDSSSTESLTSSTEEFAESGNIFYVVTEK